MAQKRPFFTTVTLLYRRPKLTINC